MSRPQPGFLSEQPEGVLLRVKLQPRASRCEIGSVTAGELKVKVTAPPVDHAANEALIEFLAGVLKCPRGSVRLIRGATARHKIIQITGLNVAEIERRLGALNPVEKK